MEGERGGGGRRAGWGVPEEATEAVKRVISFIMTALGRFAAYGGLTAVFYVTLTAAMPAMFIDSDSKRDERMRRITEERDARNAERALAKQH